MSVAVQRSLNELAKQSANSWAQQHLAAWNDPRSHESGIKTLILALAAYGYAHRIKHSEPIGEDNFLGPAFKQIAESIVTLLNGDLGRLDGGTLDALVRDICAENGVELDS